MSLHSTPESLSSGRIKERTRETAEMEPIAIDERRQFLCLNIVFDNKTGPFFGLKLMPKNFSLFKKIAKGVT